MNTKEKELRYVQFTYLNSFNLLSELYKYIMMSGSKGQNAVRACTIRCLTLGPAEHEKVVIYVVNQQISNVSELRELH